MAKPFAFLAAVLEARPDKQVFVTDMYYNRYDFEGDKRAARFRGAIQRCAAVLSGQYGGRLHYINGLKAMDTPRGCRRTDYIHRTWGMDDSRKAGRIYGRKKEVN